MSAVEYRTESLQQFLDDLAAGTSTPGGGAVAALAAAMAAGLVAMVARFSGKTVPSAADLAQQADGLRRSATLLADDDARAYEAVKSAYAVPKGTDGRPERIRTALEGATDIPLRVAARAAPSRR
jgi:formiminotetrahydrofolate cyclodeaminase